MNLPDIALYTALRSIHLENTVKFFKMLQKVFPFKIQTVQTDSGTEFIYKYISDDTECPFDAALRNASIKHKMIPLRTPWYNGKVERSHRNDNERLYSYLKFYSLEDLREQGKRYLKRTNNIPMAVLKYLTPKEKRAELEVFGMINYAI